LKTNDDLLKHINLFLLGEAKKEEVISDEKLSLIFKEKCVTFYSKD